MPHILSSGSVLGNIIDKFRPGLETFEGVYKDLHLHTELSCQEKRTAGIAANHLRSLGFVVQENIGDHGVVGVLKTGDGPTVALRG
jgi:hippurate hydrolase